MGECLQEVEGGDSLAASFMASVKECIMYLSIVRGNISCMLRDIIVQS